MDCEAYHSSVIYLYHIIFVYNIHVVYVIMVKNKDKFPVQCLDQTFKKHRMFLILICARGPVTIFYSEWKRHDIRQWLNDPCLSSHRLCKTFGHYAPNDPFVCFGRYLPCDDFLASR